MPLRTRVVSAAEFLLRTDRMFVFFSDVAKVGIKPIKLYIERMEMDQVANAVVVVQDGITPSAKQVVLYCKLELFPAIPVQS